MMHEVMHAMQQHELFFVEYMNGTHKDESLCIVVDFESPNFDV